MSDNTIDARTSNFVTVCKDCIFAEWEDNYQIGCELGRLKKFEENGYDVEMTSDESLHYYVVDTICNRCFSKHNTNDDPQIKDKVIAVGRFNYDLIVDCTGIDDVEQIKTTVDSNVNNQTIRPGKVVFLIDNLSYVDTHNMLSEIIEDGIEFEVTRVFVDNSSELVDQYDFAVKRFNKVYYVVIKCGQEVPTDFPNMLDNILNEELRPFVLLYSKEHPFHCLVVLRSLHKAFRGSKVMPIYEKIEEAAEHQLKEELISQNLILSLEEECQIYQE